MNSSIFCHFVFNAFFNRTEHNKRIFDIHTIENGKKEENAG